MNHSSSGGDFASWSTVLCASCKASISVWGDDCPSCGEPYLLEGRYRLESLLRQGTEQRTYRATRLSDGARVAVKEIALAGVRNWEALEIFGRAARVLEHLSHPGLATYLDNFVIRDGRDASLYLVRTFIEGRTLAEEIATGEYMSEEAVRFVVEQVALVLAYVHSSSPRLVHGEVKPSNIVRGADGRLFLVDFGSVKEAVSAARPGPRVTAGASHFMAPEQHQGMVLPASDVFGLGATALALLGVRFPNEPGAQTPAQAPQDMRISSPMATLLKAMLVPDPAARASAHHVAVQLQREREVHSAASAQVQPGAAVAGSRSPTLIILGAIFGVLTVTCCIGFTSALFMTPTEPSLKAWEVDAKHCAEGNAHHCGELGRRYAYGDGVAQDQTQARVFYTRSCEESIVAVCNNAGAMWQNGTGGEKDFDKARWAYERACQASEMFGCANLGDLYQFGIGVDVDMAMAVQAYERGCVQERAISCEKLGHMYQQGKGVDEDHVQASHFYRRACHEQRAEACSFLGWNYEKGLGLEQDLASAQTFYRKACDGGHGYGCYGLGLILAKSATTEADHARARQLFRKACDANTKEERACVWLEGQNVLRQCEAGNANSCALLAARHATGNGVEQSPALARASYTRSCELEISGSCNNAGIMWQNGEGGERDHEKALWAYERACRAANLDGCANVGNLFQYGLGVEADLERAARTFDSGCNQEHAYSCMKLGYMYENGLAMEQNLVQASELFARACDAKQFEACGRLGYKYERGLGVERDQLRARELYQVSCDGGYMYGCSALGMQLESIAESEEDRVRARELISKACKGGFERACKRLADKGD